MHEGEKARCLWQRKGGYRSAPLRSRRFGSAACAWPCGRWSFIDRSSSARDTGERVRGEGKARCGVKFHPIPPLGNVEPVGAGREARRGTCGLTWERRGFRSVRVCVSNKCLRSASGRRERKEQEACVAPNKTRSDGDRATEKAMEPRTRPALVLAHILSLSMQKRCTHIPTTVHSVFPARPSSSELSRALAGPLRPAPPLFELVARRCAAALFAVTARGRCPSCEAQIL